MFALVSGATQLISFRLLLAFDWHAGQLVLPSALLKDFVIYFRQRLRWAYTALKLLRDHPSTDCQLIVVARGLQGLGSDVLSIQKYPSF